MTNPTTRVWRLVLLDSDFDISIAGRICKALGRNNGNLSGRLISETPDSNSPAFTGHWLESLPTEERREIHHDVNATVVPKVDREPPKNSCDERSNR